MNHIDPIPTHDELSTERLDNVGYQPGGTAATGFVSSQQDDTTIPVFQERLTVNKQLVETGQARLVKTVHEEPQVVSVPVMAEEIFVERVPMDQLVDDVPAARQEGDTMIYPVLKEEFVIQKRLRLVEEIRVSKRQVQTTETQTVMLRREEITVERTDTTLTERLDLPGESSLINE